MRFTRIEPDINDIAAEMLEYGFPGERSVPYADGEHYRRMGLQPSLKNISYKDARINAQMRMLERELEPFFEGAAYQGGG